jgi:hypothetical protein
VTKKRLIQLFALNGGIAVFNIFIFSKSFLGLGFSLASPLAFSFSVTVLLMSVVVFIYGNMKLLKPQRVIVAGLPENASLDEWLTKLKEALWQSASFKVYGEKIAEQANRFEKLQGKINDLLLHNFKPDEMSYIRFSGAVKGLEHILIKGIKKLLSRMTAFDETEYKRLRLAGSLTGTSAQRMALYAEALNFAAAIAESNDEVLLKLDMLLAELSKLGDDSSSAEAGTSHAMEEIDSLIKNAKLYS